MKKKDGILLALTLAIFAVVGIILYSQFSSKSSTANQSTVEVIAPIAPQFNQAAVSQLGDPKQVVNFSQPVNLSNLGNAQPFGPLR